MTKDEFMQLVEEQFDVEQADPADRVLLSSALATIDESLALVRVFPQGRLREVPKLTGVEPFD